MVSRDMILNAFEKSNALFNEVKSLSLKVRSDIGKIYSAVDERFEYDVLYRNKVFDKIRDEVTFPICNRDSACSSSWLRIRSPREFTKRDKDYPNGIFPFSYTEDSVFAKAILFGWGNLDFLCFLLDDSAFRGHDLNYYILTYTHLPDGGFNRLYNQLIDKTKILLEYKRELETFESDNILSFAEFVAERYNEAVELDKKSDAEFAALFGEPTTHKKISIEITIKKFD